MRFVASFACLWLAADLAGKAQGTVPQTLLSPDALWVWWIIAGVWAAYAIVILVFGAR